MQQAVLGFRTHSGWAALVGLSGTARSPRVVLRQRIVIADPRIQGSKQPYHRAEPWPLAKAESFIRRCTESSYELARTAVGTAIKELLPEAQVRGGGLLMGSGRTADSLEAALASHTALHTAEGELYRKAIAHACDRCRIPLTKVREKEAFAHATSALRLSTDALRSRLVEMGRAVGSPWAQDEKLAALVAWIALAAATGEDRRPPQGAGV